MSNSIENKIPAFPLGKKFHQAAISISNSAWAFMVTRVFTSLSNSNSIISFNRTVGLGNSRFLSRTKVAGLVRQVRLSIYGDATIEEARALFSLSSGSSPCCFLLAQDGSLEGIIEENTLFHSAFPGDILVRSLLNSKTPYMKSTDSLKEAIVVMESSGQLFLPVVDDDTVKGVIDFRDLNRLRALVISPLKTAITGPKALLG